jgi:hypothetical protein
VYKAAAARVQQEFEDLEETWQQQHEQQMLLALPHGALLDLLKSDTLRVASENTVAYTNQAWADYQQQQQQHGDGSESEQQQQQYPSREQLQQLALQIRMQHCSQLYISTVMVHMPALAPCFTAAEWANACALGCSGDERGDSGAHQLQFGELELLQSYVPTVARFPAWRGSRRPTSSPV